jgi:hypothetical protein
MFTALYDSTNLGKQNSEASGRRSAPSLTGRCKSEKLPRVTLRCSRILLCRVGMPAGILLKQQDTGDHERREHCSGVEPPYFESTIGERLIQQISQCGAQWPREDEGAPQLAFALKDRSEVVQLDERPRTYRLFLLSDPWRSPI